VQHPLQVAQHGSCSGVACNAGSTAAAAMRWPSAARAHDRCARAGDHALSADGRSTGSATRRCRPPLRPIPTAMRRPVRFASAPLPPPLEQPSGQPRAWRMSVTSVVRKEGVGRQGLQPCTCCAGNSNSNSNSKQKRVSCGMAGWVRLRETPQTRPWGLAAHPCRGHPATGPTPPSTDFRDLLEQI
jgi:hypothetical protein